ncbi:hypothetical protein RFI_07059 [Reticulomyxa filosa]|uniref:Uncharacterized protein n=1 Tax=Reticulomyxa filosa TaxID=46433 RepID=X6NUT0_RETFI|nr:hypothetical protein RFI_07059 [Reticulomyxa filosa]|eukprot:ETO30060.1 hypothetical protein RFI_07059 [Reticulomyxa filosa]
MASTNQETDGITDDITDKQELVSLVPKQVSREGHVRRSLILPHEWTKKQSEEKHSKNNFYPTVVWEELQSILEPFTKFNESLPMEEHQQNLSSIFLKIGKHRGKGYLNWLQKKTNNDLAASLFRETLPFVCKVLQMSQTLFPQKESAASPEDKEESKTVHPLLELFSQCNESLELTMGQCVFLLICMFFGVYEHSNCNFLLTHPASLGTLAIKQTFIIIIIIIIII